MSATFVTLHFGGITATISPSDAAKVAAHSWHIFKAGRKGGKQRLLVCTKINGKRVKLHRFIMDAPDGVGVDHRDRNTLNNQRGNLRLCTQTQNTFNQSKRDGTKSRFKGVYRISQNSWQVKIGVNKTRVIVGYFATEIQAAQEYDRAAIKYHGEFAALNFPTLQLQQAA
jgi:hypothetical protein